MLNGHLHLKSAVYIVKGSCDMYLDKEGKPIVQDILDRLLNQPLDKQWHDKPPVEVQWSELFAGQN